MVFLTVVNLPLFKKCKFELGVKNNIYKRTGVKQGIGDFT
jgi:hypothetical protein